MTNSHVQWKLAKGYLQAACIANPVDGLLYINEAGIITCVDAESGRGSLSRTAPRLFMPSLIYADSKIAFFAEDTAPRPLAEFESLATNKLPAASWPAHGLPDLQPASRL